MGEVISKDGTTIAFDRTGDGPPVILVDGALCYRASGPSGPLAAQLAQHFTSSATTGAAEARAATPRRTPSSESSRTSTL